MIELKKDELVFSFPGVHHDAELRIDFQRTLRIPDDDKDYPLPPGLGSFPLRHVDDYPRKVPGRWLEHGGVMLPMYQAEAMWLSFRSKHVTGRDTSYPFVVKVAAGKINAVTGEPWANELHHTPQDYMVVPIQPWLDGYAIEKGVIRQFVAMPLGEGYSAEEQLTGEAAHGGVQIIVHPMKRRVFERRFPEITAELVDGPWREIGEMACASPASTTTQMGLGAGGRMEQEIYDDPYDFEDWERKHRSRCFIHLANSATWKGITGSEPPTRPPTAKDYSRMGFPWFEYYAEDAEALAGSERLKGLKTVGEVGEEKGESPLPENESVTPEKILEIRAELTKDQVREGSF